MGYTALTKPGTGDVLTATAYGNLIDNTLMGHPVYTNEAARDAAITAPSEGQMAYITTPTVPAATGGATYVPTGITTIYNGTSWVCVTPVGAYTSNTGTTTTSVNFTATLSGSPGTNPSVTVTTGTTALVTVSATVTNSGANVSRISAAVSGATTLAAADDWAVYVLGTNTVGASRTSIITGLTAGTNTFTLQYKVGGGTGTFDYRAITVQGIA